MAVEIINQPVDYIGPDGADFGFKVDCTGATTYQWQVSTNGGSSWVTTTITGNKTTYATQTITQERTANLYRCRLYDGSNYTYTEAVRIIIGTTPPILAQLKRLWDVKRAIRDALTAKSVSCPADYELEDVPTMIASI